MKKKGQVGTWIEKYQLPMLCAGGILCCLFGMWFGQKNELEIPVGAKMGSKRPIYGVVTEEKKIALTFDCAWENSDTQILLDLLKMNQVPATFFVTGDWCDRYPEDVRAFAEAGHRVENHSDRHPHVASIPAEKLVADTRSCDEKITQLTGRVPCYYRAPYGEFSDAMLTTFEQELGHQVIQWDADSRDWQGRGSGEMIDSLKKLVRPGSILLFHNDTENTPAALRRLIPELKGEGYEFVLIEDLVLKENYMLDHEGRQVKSTPDS